MELSFDRQAVLPSQLFAEAPSLHWRSAECRGGGRAAGQRLAACGSGRLPGPAGSAGCALARARPTYAHVWTCRPHASPGWHRMPPGRWRASTRSQASSTWHACGMSCQLQQRGWLLFPGMLFNFVFAASLMMGRPCSLFAHTHSIARHTHTTGSLAHLHVHTSWKGCQQRMRMLRQELRKMDASSARSRRYSALRRARACQHGAWPQSVRPTCCKLTAHATALSLRADQMTSGRMAARQHPA